MPAAAAVDWIPLTRGSDGDVWCDRCPAVIPPGCGYWLRCEVDTALGRVTAIMWLCAACREQEG